MTQYIPKDAIAAEIERRVQNCAKQREEMLRVQCYTLADDASARMGELNCIKDFLDTLEVKEVDLEKEIRNEIDEYWYDNDYGEIQRHGGTITMEVSDVKEIAKHFFELGLKAQKGDNE